MGCFTAAGGRSILSAMVAAIAPEPLFDAVLRPHRSLSPRGFRLLMTFFVAVFLTVGLLFASLGAWPVLPFCGLEVLLLWGAFRLNFRSGRRYEALRLTRERLEVAQVAPSGEAARHDFSPPHWLSVVLEETGGGGNRLTLRSHGRSLSIGEFLTPEEREDLARELRGALARLGKLN
jgi:uncharacterized membrane protein